MRAAIKGFKLNVTVNVGIGEIQADKNDERRDDVHNKKWNINLRGSDIKAEASLGVEFESYEGELNLSELSDILKTCIADNIKEQVKEQIEETKQSEEE